MNYLATHTRTKSRLITPVREKGLEPSRPKAQEPKSCVYTNFTTPAGVPIVSARRRARVASLNQANRSLDEVEGYLSDILPAAVDDQGVSPSGDFGDLRNARILRLDSRLTAERIHVRRRGFEQVAPGLPAAREQPQSMHKDHRSRPLAFARSISASAPSRASRSFYPQNTGVRTSRLPVWRGVDNRSGGGPSANSAPTAREDMGERGGRTTRQSEHLERFPSSGEH